MKCDRCGRSLTREPIHGMGPVCARAVLGVKPQRVKREQRTDDDATPDLFAEDLAYARRVDQLLAGVSLEMPA
jgi:hypothetical protein